MTLLRPVTRGTGFGVRVLALGMAAADDLGVSLMSGGTLLMTSFEVRGVLLACLVEVALSTLAVVLGVEVEGVLEDDFLGVAPPGDCRQEIEKSFR